MLDTLPDELLDCILLYCSCIDKNGIQYVNKALRNAHRRLYPMRPLDGLIAVGAEVLPEQFAVKPQLSNKSLCLSSESAFLRFMREVTYVIYRAGNIDQYIDRLIIGYINHKSYMTYRKNSVPVCGRLISIPHVPTKASTIETEIINISRHYIQKLVSNPWSGEHISILIKYLDAFSYLPSYIRYLTSLVDKYQTVGINTNHIENIVECIPGDIRLVSKLLIMNDIAIMTYIYSQHIHVYQPMCAKYTFGKSVIRGIENLNPTYLTDPETIAKNIWSKIPSINNHKSKLYFIYNNVYEQSKKTPNQVYYSILYAKSRTIDKELLPIYNNSAPQKVYVESEQFYYLTRP